MPSSRVRRADLESDHTLTTEHTEPDAAAEELTVADIHRWLADRREPRFMLPARFRDVSFGSFDIAHDHPEHAGIVDAVAGFVVPRASRGGWLPWRKEPDDGAGLFLVGPPGVGKTHLLASAYRAASEPKLYASFDELAAAAGPLGMARLTELLVGQALVCIDEVVLEDPGNIMLLVTLLQCMLAGDVRVVATANMPPEEAGGKVGWMRTFQRELGAISDTFETLRISGRDRREDLRDGAGRRDRQRHEVRLRASWPDLSELLDLTHPMHDAGWLERIDRIAIPDRIEMPPDKDRALRFVRFIDRVYDRDVRLTCQCPPDPDALVAPLIGDPRFIWHVARGRSRLRALLR